MLSGFYGYFDTLQDNNQYDDPYFNQSSDNYSKIFSYLEDYEYNSNINYNSNQTFIDNYNSPFSDNDEQISLYKSEFISKKRIRNIQNQIEFEPIKNDLDNNTENKNIENSGNNIIQIKKSYKVYKNKNDINNNLKKIEEAFINCILDSFNKIKNLKIILNSTWENIIIKYQLNSTSQLSKELLITTPNDYIQKILKDLNEKEITEKSELVIINPQETQKLINIIKSITNKKQNKEMIINTNIYNDFFSDKKSTAFDDLNMSIENISNSLLEEEINNKDNYLNNEIAKDNRKDNYISNSFPEKKINNDKKNLNYEISIKNRKDNLFDRLKTMIHEFFVDIFNTKVSKKNKLPPIRYNYLSKIKGKPDNIKFFEKNFKNNFLIFGKESDQLNKIQTIINNLYKNKEQNKEAIDLLEKPFKKFIDEVLNKEELRKKLFDDDRKMEIKKIENNKCRKIADLLNETNNTEALKILNKFIKKNNNDKYIFIKDANEFKKAANKIKGYENFSLDLTEKEKEKIEKRILILENLAENPMLYLNLIKQRKPRSIKKTGEKKPIFTQKIIE